MKKLLIITIVASTAFGLMACGEKKLTNEDLKAASTTLFNEDQSINMSAAPGVAEKYCQFVKQNPNDSAAASWLYQALEINTMLKEAEKSVEIGNQIVSQYPDSEWAPMSLFLLGSYVYSDLLNDTAQAHIAFQRIVDDYPQCPLVDDAKKSIEFLGLTPDEMLSRILMSQMETAEGERTDR